MIVQTIDIKIERRKTWRIHPMRSGFILNQIKLLPFCKLRLNVIAHAIGVVHMASPP